MQAVIEDVGDKGGGRGGSLSHSLVTAVLNNEDLKHGVIDRIARGTFDYQETKWKVRGRKITC